MNDIPPQILVAPEQEFFIFFVFRHFIFEVIRTQKTIDLHRRMDRIRASLREGSLSLAFATLISFPSTVIFSSFCFTQKLYHNSERE